MAVKVNDEKQLAKAVDRDEFEIEITDNLRKKVYRIKATGKVSWVVAIGAIGIAVATLMAAPATGGTSAIVAGVTAPAAVSILGSSVAVACITMAVAAGGIGVLNKLRKYKIVERNGKTFLIK